MNYIKFFKKKRFMILKMFEFFFPNFCQETNLYLPTVQNIIAPKDRGFILLKRTVYPTLFPKTSALSKATLLAIEIADTLRGCVHITLQYAPFFISMYLSSIN